MNIACIGLESVLNDIDKNLAYAQNMIEKSLDFKVDTVVLPELFTTAFYPKDIASISEHTCKVKEFFASISKKYHVNIIGGSIANFDKKLYNTSFIYNNLGENIAKYDKIHLFSNMNEDKYFSSGNSICTFKLQNITCGVIICYDLRFVELCRAVALKGVKILFVVVAWPIQRLEHLVILSLARAIENQIFVCVCNSTSHIKNVKFAGNSMIINPLGEILARGDEKEHIIHANVDIDFIDEIKKNINIYNDRKEEVYKKF